MTDNISTTRLSATERIAVAEPRNFAEAVRQYEPEATDERVEEIKLHHISALASPAEMLQELDGYMKAIGRRRKDG